MKTSDLIEAMDQISDRHIGEAVSFRGKKKKVMWMRLAAVAACVCVVIGGALLWSRTEVPLTKENPLNNSKQKAEGVTIPPAAIKLSQSEGMLADMVAFVIYEDRCYMEFQQELLNTDLLGRRLGTSTGLIDEWTEKDGYVNFAGSVAGDFYQVKGYDPDFMICMLDYSGRLLLLVNNNGITLDKGEELFEKRLHMIGNVEKVQYQSREDWYNGNGNIKNFDGADRKALEEFVEALNNSNFMSMDDISLDEGQSDIYDSLESCHLYFHMKDGMIIHLRCFEGGYVMYSGIPDVCVKIDQKVFDAVCGGRPTS